MKLQYGSKGFIITVDIVFAIALVFLLLSVASYYFVQSKPTIANKISAARIGADVMAVLDYTEVLDTLDENLIAYEIEKLLPNNVNMSMQIYVYDSNMQPENVIFINDNPEIYTSGKWIFVTFINGIKYNLVNYKVSLI